MIPIKKVLVIGSGPIVIGQAAEFDYAGTQACKALREEGVTTILCNSNPATIMTDQGIADVVYIEPLTLEVLTRIIEKERPDGLLPTLGGQTGLNLAVELAEADVLDKYSVRLLGTPLDTIRKAEDRQRFRDLLLEIGEPLPESSTANSIQEALSVGHKIGLPLVIRPAYTLGGTGGGVVNTWSALERIVESGLASSPINQVLVERSLTGWKEIEYEVMRDHAGTVVTICNMENLDPMGVHTGDSIVVAPSQTLSDKDYHMLRSASLRIISALGIEGGCNVQFALKPGLEVQSAFPSRNLEESEYYVIEVNPRVSRSSALASKATGYPIARVAAKIAVGKRLDEIPNSVTGKTQAAFEPALDYCVVKIPRWPFDKFATGDRSLGTQMKATGEIMAIDRCFEAALQKAVRSLELPGTSLLWEDPSWELDQIHSKKSLMESLPLDPSDIRLWALTAALRRQVLPEELSMRTGIDPWFTGALNNIVAMEKRLSSQPFSSNLLWDSKRLGFSDDQISALINSSQEEVRKQRINWNIKPVYKMVDTCAAEFEAITPYFYSTYEEENEAVALSDPKVLVIGSGPIRIGQGIEFDYCSVHAAWALEEMGIKSIMVNSNPETVSTDFDTSSRLYFEPLDEESIRDILENEAGSGDPPPCVVQFGGQTAINLSQALDKVGLPILGSSADNIDIASDRQRFGEFLAKIGIPEPPGSSVSSVEEALKIAQDIAYPVLVRPSYVLGGRAMEIVQNPTELVRYLTLAAEIGHGRPVLIDKYLEGREVEVDAICDGEEVLIPGIMEHVERAGVHSGDSMAIYPGLTLSPAEVTDIVKYTTSIGLGLKMEGLMNIQYVIMGGGAYRSAAAQATGNAPELNSSTLIYVLEVNPRSSRTVPFMSKVTGVPMVNLATKAMLGKSLRDLGYSGGLWHRTNLVAVKAPVFSMAKLTGVDTYLGPEMKSTGEVMGIDYDFPSAVAKALLASGLMLPRSGSILLSIADRDKAEAIPMIHQIADLGYRIYATEGTAITIGALGIPVITVNKMLDQGHPNVLDIIQEGSVDAIINTISGESGPMRDGFEIRRTAVERRIPCFTSLDTARAVLESLSSGAQGYSVQHQQSYLET